MWSVPFAGATAERGAEFILPHDTELIELARRLELRLVRKGTLYGNREPRGGEPVSGDEIAAAMEQLGALPEIQGENVYGALSRAGCESGVADAIAARLEVSCAYGADDLDASVLREGAGAFGDFHTHTVRGGNDRIARRLAEPLGRHRASVLSGAVDPLDAARDEGAHRRRGSSRRRRCRGGARERHRGDQVRAAARRAEGRRPPVGALRAGREAVRAASRPRAAQPGPVGPRPLVVLHAARRRRRAVAVRRRVRREPAARSRRWTSATARGSGPTISRGCDRTSSSTPTRR